MYGNTDDHTQFNHNILVIKFWKRSLRGGKFYYNLHNRVERGTQLCLTFVCLKFSGWGMQEGLSRVPGISWAAGRADGEAAPAWGSTGDPGVAAVPLCHCHCHCPGRAGTGARRKAAWGSPHPASLAGSQAQTRSPKPGDGTVLVVQAPNCSWMS